MEKHESQRVRLDPERKKRMDTLSREIHSRLEEMAQVMSESLGMELGSGANLRFAPKRAAGGATAQRQIEIIDLPDGTYACYDTEEAVCVYPC